MLPEVLIFCIVDGMVLVHSRVDLPSAFGGVAIMTLSRLVRHANRLDANRVDFACDSYKYPSINDITTEVHGLVQGEVNICGHEKRMPIFFSTFSQNHLISVAIIGKRVVPK